MNEIIDKTARYLHHTWKAEKEKKGFHLPQKCPQFEKKFDQEKETMADDVIHCSKCNINMGQFEQLDQFSRDQYYEKAQNLCQGIKEFGLEIISAP